MKTKILIVEDQFIEANNLQMILERAGYRVCPIARSVTIALGIVERERPDMVLLDIYLQGNRNGIDLAKILREKNIAFVYLSANSNKQIFEEAKATRPYGFLVKPFRERDVLVMLDVAWYLHEHNHLQSSSNTGTFRRPDAQPDSTEPTSIIGKSRGTQEILARIRTVSQSDTSVLILGESGTGKELVAQAVHRNSARKKQALVVVNCAALPASLIESELFGHEKGAFTGAYTKKVGKFELAEGGTIFLDEIGELPLDLQVKFLRVLQEKEIETIGGGCKKVNVRIIAATNRNLEDEIAHGRFRIDLYYRLNVFPIVLPPLRDRKEDILLLANHFLSVYAKKEHKDIKGLSDQVAAALLNFHWPGNVRELENIMERSVLLATGPIIDSVVLPNPVTPAMTSTGEERIKTMEENERDHILLALQNCAWKIYGPRGAAELLNMNSSTLNSRIKKLGIKRPGSLK
ncbi:MAG TPA: sigma-54 dependent transcriptional regulator [Puia sp.]|nr:sigma-54 dependent transcriptional regulator [Puia sp.]